MFTGSLPKAPPHTIICVPVHTAVGTLRAGGAPFVVVAAQLLLAGLYLPPVRVKSPLFSTPPQTIISLPVHTAVCRTRPGGTFARLRRPSVGLGIYRPPVSR